MEQALAFGDEGLRADGAALDDGDAIDRLVEMRTVLDADGQFALLALAFRDDER